MNPPWLGPPGTQPSVVEESAPPGTPVVAQEVLSEDGTLVPACDGGGMTVVVTSAGDLVVAAPLDPHAVSVNPKKIANSTGAAVKDRTPNLTALMSS